MQNYKSASDDRLMDNPQLVESGLNRLEIEQS